MSVIRSDDKRRDLIAALKPFAETDTRHLLDGHDIAMMTAFVTRTREAIGELEMAVAALIVVVEGAKEIVWGADSHVYRAGEAIVLPVGAHIDVVNTPDETSGVYRALCISFSRELVIEAARRWPALTATSAPGRAAVPVDDMLGSAVVHAGEALCGKTPATRRMMDHRILEILLVLAERGVLPITPKYVERSVADAVRMMIRHRLDHAWTPSEIADRLSISEATLRRRLRAEGQTVRGVLLKERMDAAHLILSERDADVADAIAATGYSSRSHFARHFQEAFGVPPSAVRGRRRAGIEA